MSKRLNTTDTPEAGDQVVLFRTKNSDYRAIPFDALVQAILSQVPTPEYVQPKVQHFNPNGNFSINVENYPEGTYLYLNPSAGIETGEIKLPALVDVTDKQELSVACSQQINNFTVTGNGSAVIGAPNALNATGFFKLRFDKLSGTWYRVG